MPQAPPVLPEETLRRVRRVARVDGLSVAVVAGFAALACAATGNALGATIGLLVAGAGALELHGVAILDRGASRGMAWLIASQTCLLAIVLSYCTLRLTHIDLTLQRAMFQEALKNELIRNLWTMNQAAGWTETEFLLLNYRLTYAALALVTAVYQGGMLFYYARRRAAVEQALAE